MTQASRSDGRSSLCRNGRAAGCRDREPARALADPAHLRTCLEPPSGPLRHLGLGPAELESHIAWDPGALGVAQELSRLLDAPLIHATVSRLVLDLNRDPSAPDSIWTLSERTTIPGNLDLDAGRARLPRARGLRGVPRRGRCLRECAHGGRTDSAPSCPSIPSRRSIADVPRPWQIGLIFDRGRALRPQRRGRT